MQDKSLLEMLPIELVQHISSFLEYKSIADVSKVSKAWQGLFNDDSIWKYQLKKDFGIENDQFSQFEKIIREEHNYKQLYVRFHYLSQQPSLPLFLKNIYRDKTQHYLVLLACTDNDTCLDEMTREQQYTIAVLAMYAGCFEIPRSFLEKHLGEKFSLFKLKSENLLEHAARSGNLKLVEYLLPENQFSVKYNDILLRAIESGNLQLVKYLNKLGSNPNDYLLNVAAKCGNLKLVEYLLNPENKFGLKPDYTTLRMAAKSGHLKLVQYLLNQLGLIPYVMTLHSAAESGNLQLIQYLLNLENKSDLKPDSLTLNFAAQSGNLQLMKYLLNPENKFELKPDSWTLNYAAQSSNLQLVQYLLNPENKFELKPEKNTLDRAAESGNLQLVQYLLNPENKFGLRPDDSTPNYAAQSGNSQLVQYLLHPENKFELKPTDLTLHNAAKSGNLQLVQYLLHPENKFDLQATLSTQTNAFYSTNLVLSEQLLPCHIRMQQALMQLKANKQKVVAKTLLQQSHLACPSHHNMMLQYILNNPQRFNLNESAIKCLKEHSGALLQDEKMSTGVSLSF